MGDKLDLYKLGLTNSGISYADIVAPERGKILRAYCSSPRCSTTDNPTLKHSINANQKVEGDDGSVYFKRPVDCPDCGYALIWRREHFRS